MDNLAQRFKCPFTGCNASFKHMSSRSRHKNICEFRPQETVPDATVATASATPDEPRQRTFGHEDTGHFSVDELTAWVKSCNLFDVLQEVVQRLYFDATKPSNMTVIGSHPGSNLALVWDAAALCWHPCSLMWVAGEMNRRVAGLLFDHMHKALRRYTMRERNRMEHFFMNATSQTLEGERRSTIETIRKYTDTVIVNHSHGAVGSALCQELQSSDIGVHHEPPRSITGKRGWRWIDSSNAVLVPLF